MIDQTIAWFLIVIASILVGMIVVAMACFVVASDDPYPRNHRRRNRP